MTITLRSTKGSALTTSELDGNFTDLDTRTTTLEGATPVGVSSITYSGNAITFTLTDSSTQGPFPLPVLELNVRGVWQPDTSYSYGDLVNVRTVGLFLVLIDHTSASTFDASADDGTTDGNLLYKQYGPAVDIEAQFHFNLSGVVNGETSLPLVNQYIVVHPMIMDADLATSGAFLGTAPASEDLVLTIEKNEVIVGSITFSISSQVGTFSFENDVNFGVGDRLAVRGPDVDDGSAADLSITLIGTRTDI